MPIQRSKDVLRGQVFSKLGSVCHPKSFTALIISEAVSNEVTALKSTKSKSKKRRRRTSKKHETSHDLFIPVQDTEQGLDQKTY